MLGRPPSDRDQLRQPRHRHPRIDGSNGHPCEHLGEADLPIGVTRLGERHRPHRKKRESARSRVAIDVIGRHRRTREDELTRSLTLVDSPANVVPDRRLDLPLVQQPGNRPVQHQRRIDTRRSERLRVDVEQHHAARPPPGRLGLAARLGAFDDHGAHSIESATQLIIDNSWQVAHPSRLRATHRSIAPHTVRIVLILLSTSYHCGSTIRTSNVKTTLPHRGGQRAGGAAKGRFTQVDQVKFSRRHVSPRAPNPHM